MIIWKQAREVYHPRGVWYQLYQVSCQSIRSQYYTRLRDKALSDDTYYALYFEWFPKHFIVAFYVDVGVGAHGSLTKL